MEKFTDVLKDLKMCIYQFTTLLVYYLNCSRSSHALSPRVS
jgi:hypothetical protein